MNYAKGEKIRFALIGCGAIAHKHIMAVNRLNDAEVVGAYDISLQTAKAFCEKYSIPVFTSTEELIKKTDPHVLTILTPSGLHAENILELARFNKHFVVEKPLAFRLDQIDKILEEFDKRELKIL